MLTRDARREARALPLLALSLLACDRASLAHAPHDIDAGPVFLAAPDAAADVASTTQARCPIRALPPDELTSGTTPEGSSSVAWSGRDWGVAWSEDASGEPTVFFARVEADGHRRGPAVRLSEHGYRGRAPSVVWNGENWNVAFAGGASRWDEIWFGRVDPRGTPLGRPHRITARDRRDGAPHVAFNGQDLALVWTSWLDDNRYGVYALRLNRWGAQVAAPLRLADRAERLAQAEVLWNGTGWTAAWFVARSEATAVDMIRVEPSLEATRGYVVRVTSGPLGGTNSGARYGVAWNGSRYGIVWDEVREGRPHVFFETASLRLDDTSSAVMVSLASDAATSPAVAALDDGRFVVAWDIERGLERHVQIVTLNGDGAVLGEAIEVQGNDGWAASPSIAVAHDALGVATMSARGVEFHHVALGPCHAPDR